MIIRAYSVFDSKTASFNPPHYVHTDQAAIRNFADYVNDQSIPNNQWYKHPEDFSLWFVGEFDQETGSFVPGIPVNLVTASAIKDLREVVNPLGSKMGQGVFPFSAEDLKKENVS